MASHSTKPIYAVNATRAEVDAIARRHHLLPQHYRCLWRVLARGEIKSDDFGNRIVWQPNYSPALSMSYWCSHRVTLTTYARQDRSRYAR